MISVSVLGSGSSGNALLVEGTRGAVLIDQGFHPKSLVRRLKALGRQPEQISAVLLTHEHTDHASGVVAAHRRWGWPLFASAGTLAALTDSPTGCPSNATPLRIGADTEVHGFDVEPTLVPHDARACVAFVLTDRTSGCRVGIALDLGRVPRALSTAFSHLDLLVLESNYDEQMLATGPYPMTVKRRISGGLGHLSNRTAAAFAATCVHRGLRGVVLAHLSATNNTPRRAVEGATAALRRAGWHRDAVWAAHQITPSGPHRSAERASRPTVQLQLSFQD